MKDQTKTAEILPKEKKAMNPKREQLIINSIAAKAIRQAKVDESTTAQEAIFWTSKTVNYMLIHHVYDTQGATELNTFHQWKEKGATIKKGAQGFAIWGQPINKQKKEGTGTPDPENDFEFFPMCYLFSDLQVIISKEEDKTDFQTVNV
ncbi:ArdC-like ssDNA-binding domain-containing protein [Mongoliitalea lutea]|uniref:N-terminal domain-containing protein n=1 Tax=Mongoliitalea lutea TaxID=849756 RepID=A0A8J3CYE6_9BACT|nr:ArdC-like ssDNA-binding domain-containing protein [Mongoliitalea lutea]GHB44354.1 hypothetical protein GCM10008106_26760 [Mongoliitalea lutea]